MLITLVVASVSVQKQTGINPVTFGKSDNAHDYIGFIMKVITSLLVVTVILFAVSEETYVYLNPFFYLEKDIVKYVGLILVHLALIWIIIAQAQMQQSWRIGIDEKHKTALVTKGLFSISRNPIFLGMIMSTLGIFMILPNAATLFITLTSYIIIQIQIRLEEEHLLKQHGLAYSSYAKTVRRLL